MERKKIVLRLRIFLVIGILIFILWILNQHFIIFGELKTINDFSQKNPFISFLQGNVTPPLKNLYDEETYQELHSNRAYSSIKIPQGIEKMQIAIQCDRLDSLVSISYQDKEKKEKEIIAYDKKIIDSNWNLGIIEGQDVIYRRDAEAPESLESLFEKYPQQIGFYRNKILSDSYRQQIISNQKKEYEINLPLRGSHTLEVYVGENGLIDLTIEYKKNDNRSEIVEQNINATLNLPDKQKQYHIVPFQGKNILAIYENNLLPGNYIISINDDSDLTINSIKTGNYFAIQKKIELNDKDKTADINFTAENIILYTFHGTGVQNININNSVQKLNFKEKMFYENSAYSSNLKANKADFILYSYDSEAKFYPAEFSREFIDAGNSADIDTIINTKKYILFNTSDEFRMLLIGKSAVENSIIQLSLNPGDMYKKEDGTVDIYFNFENTGIKMKNIEVTYYRSFLSYIRNYFTKFK